MLTGMPTGELTFFIIGTMVHINRSLKRISSPKNAVNVKTVLEYDRTCKNTVTVVSNQQWVIEYSLSLAISNVIGLNLFLGGKSRRIT